MISNFFLLTFDFGLTDHEYTYSVHLISAIHLNNCHFTFDRLYKNIYKRYVSEKYAKLVCKRNSDLIAFKANCFKNPFSPVLQSI